MRTDLIYQDILEYIGRGERDTVEIGAATGLCYRALSQRLFRLAANGLIERRGRRAKPRDGMVGYPLIWARAEPKPKPPVPTGEFRIAGRIVHGRGSNWKAGW